MLLLFTGILELYLPEKLHLIQKSQITLSDVNAFVQILLIMKLLVDKDGKGEMVKAFKPEDKLALL